MASGAFPLIQMISLDPSPSMFEKARGVADSMCTFQSRINAHIEIAKCDSQHDFSYARKCAGKSASESINAYESFYKECETKGWYLTFREVEKIDRLKDDMEVDLRTQKCYFRAIRKAEVECNLPPTEDVLDNTYTTESKKWHLDEALTEMISLKPCPKMIQYAKDFAESMGIRLEQVYSLIAIAKLDPQHDFSLAKKHALSVLDSDILPFERDLKGRDLYRQKIAGAEAPFDLAAAKAMADGIVDPLWKEIAYLRVIEIEAETDIQAAQKTRDATIKDPLRIDAANKYIASNLAKKDVLAAKEMAASIKDELHQKGAFAGIAKIEARQ